MDKKRSSKIEGFRNARCWIADEKRALSYIDVMRSMSSTYEEYWGRMDVRSLVACVSLLTASSTQCRYVCDHFLTLSARPSVIVKNNLTKGNLFAELEIRQAQEDYIDVGLSQLQRGNKSRVKDIALDLLLTLISKLVSIVDSASTRANARFEFGPMLRLINNLCRYVVNYVCHNMVHWMCIEGDNTDKSDSILRMFCSMFYGALMEVLEDPCDAELTFDQYLFKYKLFDFEAGYPSVKPLLYNNDSEEAVGRYVSGSPPLLICMICYEEDVSSISFKEESLPLILPGNGKDVFILNATPGEGDKLIEELTDKMDVCSIETDVPDLVDCPVEPNISSSDIEECESVYEVLMRLQEQESAEQLIKLHGRSFEYGDDVCFADESSTRLIDRSEISVELEKFDDILQAKKREKARLTKSRSKSKFITAVSDAISTVYDSFFPSPILDFPYLEPAYEDLGDTGFKKRPRWPDGTRVTTEKAIEERYEEKGFTKRRRFAILEDLVGDSGIPSSYVDDLRWYTEFEESHKDPVLYSKNRDGGSPHRDQLF